MNMTEDLMITTEKIETTTKKIIGHTEVLVEVIMKGSIKQGTNMTQVIDIEIMIDLQILGTITIRMKEATEDEAEVHIEEEEVIHIVPRTNSVISA